MISAEDEEVLVKQVSDFIRSLKLNVSQKLLKRSYFFASIAVCWRIALNHLNDLIRGFLRGMIFAFRPNNVKISVRYQSK